MHLDVQDGAAALAVLVGGAALLALAPTLRIPYPILLVLGGLVLAPLPRLRRPPAGPSPGSPRASPRSSSTPRSSSLAPPRRCSTEPRSSPRSVTCVRPVAPSGSWRSVSWLPRRSASRWSPTPSSP